MFTSKKSLHIISTPQQYQSSLISFAQILHSLNNVESCAYINLSTTNHQQISLLEQIFLRTHLAREYPQINIDYYLLFKHEHITRGILSQAEYQNFHVSKLLSSVFYFKYQVIIIDNCTHQSPYFSTLLSIINSSSIESHIIVITSTSQSIEKAVDSSIQTISKYRYEEHMLTSNHDHQESSLATSNKASLSNVSTNNSLFLIDSIDEFSSWISLAYHFTMLKTNGPKRFFFISEYTRFSKEILFISILKKHLKQLKEFEQWDFMTSRKDQHLESNLLNQNNLNQLLYFARQSLHVSGTTTLLCSQQINEEMGPHIASLFTQHHNNSVIISNILYNSNVSSSQISPNIVFKKEQ